MEPNKFERKIRNKLEHREIRPSEELWTRIENELKTSNQPSEKSTRKPKYWIGIAASIAILLSISYFLSNRSNEVDQNVIQEVVGTEELDNNIKKQGSEIEFEEELNKSTQESIANHPIIIQESSQKIAKKLDSSTDFDQKITRIVIDQNEVSIDTIQGLDKSITALIEKVNLLEKTQGNLTDKEVDSLLRDAQKDLLKQEKIRPTKLIDAMALLDEVEYEIDATLKEKLFEALKKGFIEVRTAVAQRNQ